jgi:hypothetical protein
MPTRVNLKNDDASHRAYRLSEQRMRDRTALKSRLIAMQIRASMPGDVTSDHRWLYDHETGLPA